MSAFWRLRRGEVAFCLVVAVIYVGLAAFATHPRPGVAPDSVGYLRVTENLIAGHGFTLATAAHTLDGRDVPFTSHPPVYPLVIALLAWLWPGNDGVLAAARWIPILSAALTILPLYWLGRALAVGELKPGLDRSADGTAGRWVAVLSVVTVLSLQNYLGIVTFALADALFILLVGLCLCILVAMPGVIGTSRPSLGWFALLGGLVMSAHLTRSVGILFVATVGATFLLLARRWGWRAMIGPSVVFATVYLPLVVVWYARNMRLAGTFSGYAYVTDRFQYTFAQAAGLALRTAATDLVPKLHLGIKQNMGLLIVLSGVGLLVLAAGAWRGRHAIRAAAGAPRDWLGWIGWPVAVYVVTTSAGLITIAGTVQVYPTEWSRYLGAVYPFAIVLGWTGLVRLWCAGVPGPADSRDRMPARWMRPAAAGLVIAFIAYAYTRPMLGLAAAAGSGQQLTAPTWVASQGIRFVRDNIPSNATLYSDRVEAIWYWTRRDATLVPLTTAGDAAIERFMADVTRHAGTYVVLFTGAHYSPFRMTAEDLRRRDTTGALRKVRVLEDAVVIKVGQQGVPTKQLPMLTWDCQAEGGEAVAWEPLRQARNLEEALR